MTDMSEARLQALEEASTQARRMARQWMEEAEGNHSSHHAELRRAWAEAAERVAEAIAGLARRSGAGR